MDTAQVQAALMGDLNSLLPLLEEAYVDQRRVVVSKATDLVELNERAAEWAANEAGNLIRGIEMEDRRLIQSIMRRALVNGWDDKTVQAKVRAVVGLTAKQADAAEAMRQTMVNEGMPPGKARARKRDYVNRLREHRARTIVQYETQNALNAAQLDMWREKVVDGDLPAWATRRWVTHADDRRCAACRALNGQRASLKPGATYTNGVEHPPLHPNCRCYEKVEVDV